MIAGFIACAGLSFVIVSNWDKDHDLGSGAGVAIISCVAGHPAGRFCGSTGSGALPHIAGSAIPGTCIFCILLAISITCDIFSCLLSLLDLRYNLSISNPYTVSNFFNRSSHDQILSHGNTCVSVNAFPTISLNSAFSRLFNTV